MSRVTPNIVSALGYKIFLMFAAINFGGMGTGFVGNNMGGGFTGGRGGGMIPQGPRGGGMGGFGGGRGGGMMGGMGMAA